MRKLLLILGLTVLVNPKARASTDVNVVFSSATVTQVKCSTGTATRIDNASQNGGSLIDYPRIDVWIQNQSSFRAALGFDSNVSTVAGNGYAGFTLFESTYPAGQSSYDTGALPALKIWCMAYDAAGAGGINVAVVQKAKE